MVRHAVPAEFSVVSCFPRRLSLIAGVCVFNHTMSATSDESGRKPSRGPPPPLGGPLKLIIPPDPEYTDAALDVAGQAHVQKVQQILAYLKLSHYFPILIENGMCCWVTSDSSLNQTMLSFWSTRSHPYICCIRQYSTRAKTVSLFILFVVRQRHCP